MSLFSLSPARSAAWSAAWLRSASLSRSPRRLPAERKPPPAASARVSPYDPSPSSLGDGESILFPGGREDAVRPCRVSLSSTGRPVRGGSPSLPLPISLTILSKSIVIDESRVRVGCSYSDSMELRNLIRDALMQGRRSSRELGLAWLVPGRGISSPVVASVIAAWGAYPSLAGANGLPNGLPPRLSSWKSVV